MNAQEYWATVRKKEAELKVQFPEGYCKVISVDNLQRNSTAGNIVEVNLRQAAEHLLAGTHRLLTGAEAESYQREQSAIRARNHSDELARVKEQFAAVTKGLL
jgi:hypothetical protein